MIRIWRSWKSAFGEFTRDFRPDQDECQTAIDIYTDEELDRIHQAGFNAIWVHAQINHLVRTEVFPELGDSAAEFQSRINALIERASKHGIGVYLYMQIPRGLPQDHPLWKNHPECAGLPDLFPDENGTLIPMLPMCTSVPKVRDYLSAAAGELARKVPGIAGVILITASEYVSHCFGRGGRIASSDGKPKFVQVDCPRCSKRSPVEAVSEIIRIMADGIHSISPAVKVIVWNWSWTMYEKSPCLGMIRALPDDVILLADFERGGKRQLFGREIIVNEYSLSYTGPSEQFQEVYAAAKARGMKMIAKLQLGTTHELADVPNLPLIGNIRKKAVRVSALDLEGYMGCWNFGNMPSANTEAFQFFMKNPDLDITDFASAYFPGCLPDRTAAVWKLFEEAMDFYPFDNNWLYFGPTNLSPALPFEPGPVSDLSAGRSWLLETVRGDNIARAFTFCTPEEVIRSLEKLTGLWDEAVKQLETGLAPSRTVQARQELTNAVACGCLFRGALNYVRSYRLKTHWHEDCRKEWTEIACAELENLKKLLPAAEQDSRIGYHIEADGYMFTPDLIRQKIARLETITGTP